ncbi:MAG: hypothetical protein ACFFCZ_23610 [Promethearchaeota archaeon]
MKKVEAIFKKFEKEKKENNLPVFENILQIIGKTPIVKLQKIAKNLLSEIFVKLESYPDSGIKDRAASLKMKIK